MSGREEFGASPHSPARASSVEALRAEVERLRGQVAFEQSLGRQAFDAGYRAGAEQQRVSEDRGRMYRQVGRVEQEEAESRA
jgi:hypothetical protein